MAGMSKTTHVVANGDLVRHRSVASPGASSARRFFFLDNLTGCRNSW